MPQPLITALTELVRDPKAPDLSGRQIATLGRIASVEDADRTVRALATFLNVQKPTISRAADRLTELGLVVRAPDPTDKRSVLIRPTAKGRKFLAQFFGPTERAP